MIHQPIKTVKIEINTNLSNNRWNVIILKFDGDGNYLKNIIIDNGLNTESGYAFNVDENNNLVVSVDGISGNTKISGENTISGEELVLNGYDYIIYFDENMNYVWSYKLAGQNISFDDESNIYVLYPFYYNINFPAEDTVNNSEINLSSNGSEDIAIIKFNKDGKIITANSIGGSSRELVNSYIGNENLLIGKTEDGFIISAEDTVKNEEIKINAKGNILSTGFIIKYTEDYKVEWTFNLIGIEGIYFSAVPYKNGYVAIGRLEQNILNIPAEKTVNGQEILITNSRGIVLWLNNEGKVEKAIGISIPISGDIIKCINNEFYVSGMSKIYEKIVLPSIPDIQEISVDNYKKQYNIGTLVNGEGGTISGQSQDPYEEVTIHEDSVKDIVITPDEGYRISNITINGERIEYISDEDGIVKLDKFIDMTENKIIEVTFAKEEDMFTINKVNTDGEKLSGAKFELEKVTVDDPSIAENAVGDIISAGTGYDFEKVGNKYIPGNLNVVGSTAISYLMIDLSEAQDEYEITLNIKANMGQSDIVQVAIADSNDEESMKYLALII